jgi:DEAD/DEAH box helicase
LLRVVLQSLLRWSLLLRGSEWPAMVLHEHQHPAQNSCQCPSAQALEGKDIVARARTGSGKTLAYLLPALQAVLTGGKGRAGWQALILVPSRELCEQVGLLCVSCRRACSNHAKHADVASCELVDCAHPAWQLEQLLFSICLRADGRCIVT